jgi:hypothetical protein
MTPRKGETPAEFARACGHGTPPPVLTIENGGWQDNGNGGGDATRPIPSIGKRSWNGSGNATPASGNHKGSEQPLGFRGSVL